ncbi:DUF2971 domain-containing protein [Pseudovibrio sp. Ad37]|uniref:DUF2971 domain-containing protein n=1 Tax=Pseudovibrio sp. Ad37 TaxID=989422 RepID=UPI0007AEBF77|nr:DUF2971 domain-containing protein [Pseudovibrio sp. Ad37]KZL26270.1 hypothetical protein PsAD37_01949 [Pseudovibrio sp. Ad37]
MSDFIYHYTTIQALACILEKRTIRLTRLDCLNDPDEGAAVTFDNAAKQVYCSSWTSLSHDTIPMWRMYSGFDGVRLGLPAKMFKIHSDIINVSKEPGYPIKFSSLNTKITVTTQNSATGETVHAYLDQLLGPDEIHYKLNTSQTLAVVHANNYGEERDFHNYKKIGLFKAHHWEFENEVRFRLVQNLNTVLPSGIARQVRDDISYAEKAVHIPLKDDILDHAQILLGPNCKDSPNAIIVEALVEKYAPLARISESQIRVAER